MTFQKMYKTCPVVIFLVLCFGSWISYAEVAPIDPELEAKVQFSSEGSSGKIYYSKKLYSKVWNKRIPWNKGTLW